MITVRIMEAAIAEVIRIPMEMEFVTIILAAAVLAAADITVDVIMVEVITGKQHKGDKLCAVSRRLNRQSNHILI